MEKNWRALDDEIRSWWDDDLVGPERAVTATPDAFALPRPYVAGAAPGSPSWYLTMFNWDAHFINLALLVHDRPEIVDDHLENFLWLIDRFGFVPNGNQTGLSTRSQPPLAIESFWARLRERGDRAMITRAYTGFTREYEGYWLADHHATPTGLVTHADLGDPNLEPRLAAEAETGLDFTTQFEGDVTKTNPVLINSALVVVARTLAEMATELGDTAAAQQRAAEADRRAALIREFCWSEERGLFMDYRFDQQRHVDTIGASAYFALWAGVATPEQARRSAEALPLLLEPYGLATTEAPSPGADSTRYALPYEDLQWTHPANWPPLSIIAVQGLDRYGLDEAAESVARAQLQTILDAYAQSGRLYEKYNAVDGGIDLPNGRYGTIPLHGWTSAAVVLLGRRLFEPARSATVLRPGNPSFLDWGA